MSAAKYVTLYCDQKGCTREPLQTVYLTIRAARQYAREMGWTSVRGDRITFDYCHRHAA